MTFCIGNQSFLECKHCFEIDSCVCKMQLSTVYLQEKQGYKTAYTKLSQNGQRLHQAFDFKTYVAILY